MAKIAVLGFGTVGGGVARVLEEDRAAIAARLGEEISLAEPEVLAFITGQVAEGIAECCPAPEKL